MKWSFALLAAFSLPALATEPELRPSARRLLAEPAWAQPGRCVRYAEMGGASVLAPSYYLTGKLVSSELVTRRMAVCPSVPGKALAQYTRDEFVRYVATYPCVSEATWQREVSMGRVRLQVIDWETPHARSAANAGRLYRGFWLEQKLEKNLVVEMEADLLALCD